MLALQLLLAATAFAAPVLVERACVYECGRVCYTQANIDAAVNTGYGYLQDSTTAGSSTYPHKYNDYEGFEFPTSGPWYEFPILPSHKVYTGGSPGADRVIFDSHGAFDSVITHQGASGNAFVGCVL